MSSRDNVDAKFNLVFQPTIGGTFANKTPYIRSAPFLLEPQLFKTTVRCNNWYELNVGNETYLSFTVDPSASGMFSANIGKLTVGEAVTGIITGLLTYEEGGAYYSFAPSRGTAYLVLETKPRPSSTYRVELYGEKLIVK